MQDSSFSSYCAFSKGYSSVSLIINNFYDGHTSFVKMLQITIKGIPAAAVPDVKEDPSMGFYFEIEGIVAEVPPEFSGKQFGPNEVFTFFITTITTIGANVLARFIYDLLKKNQATSVTINNYTINSGN